MTYFDKSRFSKGNVTKIWFLRLFALNRFKSIAKIFSKLGYFVNSNPLCLDEMDDYILLDNNINYYVYDDIEKVVKNLDTFNMFHDIPYSMNYKYFII